VWQSTSTRIVREVQIEAHGELEAAGLDVDVRWDARPSEVIAPITAATETSDS